jgi:type IV secretory pathway VirD2 relaxase
MISRVKHLERYGLANEVEPGRWGVSDRAEGSSTELSERNGVIETEIRRALPRWANVWVEKLDMQ